MTEFRRTGGYLSGNDEMKIPPVPGGPAGQASPPLAEAMKQGAELEPSRWAEVVKVNADIHSLVPLISFAQELEQLLDRKPVLLLPAHVAPGCTQVYGYRVMRASVPSAMVAFDRP